MSGRAASTIISPAPPWQARATTLPSPLGIPVSTPLVPAIACIESTKGAYCANSYNAWGWSARGGGWRSFGSWSEGISAHVAYLGANYGSTLTPAAAKKYCPPTWQDWYNKVAAQMNRI